MWQKLNQFFTVHFHFSSSSSSFPPPSLLLPSSSPPPSLLLPSSSLSSSFPLSSSSSSPLSSSPFLCGYTMTSNSISMCNIYIIVAISTIPAFLLVQQLAQDGVSWPCSHPTKAFMASTLTTKVDQTQTLAISRPDPLCRHWLSVHEFFSYHLVSCPVAHPIFSFCM